MKAKVNGYEIYFDVDGLQYEPDGPVMREKPQVKAPKSKDDAALDNGSKRKYKLEKPEPIEEKSVEAPIKVR